MIIGIFKIWSITKLWHRSKVPEQQSLCEPSFIQHQSNYLWDILFLPYFILNYLLGRVGCESVESVVASVKLFLHSTLAK